MKKILVNVLNVAWKAGVGMIGLFVLFLFVLFASDKINDKYGRAKWRDKSLSKSVIVRAYNNDVYRVYNRQTKRYTTPKVSWVSGIPARDSITVFCDRTGRRGFLNINTGDIVIPAQYKKAWQFSEGLAAVMGSNGKIGFIDYNNNLVIDYEIPYRDCDDYIFKDGYCTVVYWDKELREYRYALYGLKQCGRVIDWNYTQIYSPNSDGYRIAKNDDGYWLYDKDFNLVFDHPFENIRYGYDVDGIYVTKNYVKQRIDYDGTVLDPFVIDDVERISYVSGLTSPIYDYDDEYYDQEETMEFERDIMVYEVNSKYGLMDAHTGRIITPAKYASIVMVSKELFRADLGDAYSESVLIDRRGKVVL